MAKNIAQRIKDSLEKIPEAEAKEYEQRLLDSWKDLAALFAKQIVLLLLHMAIFELLAYQRPAATVTIGSFSLSNTIVILTALPPIVSFLSYEIISLAKRLANIFSAYYIIYRKLWPGQAENDLQQLITPVTGFVRIGNFASPNSQFKSERYTAFLNAVLLVVVMLIFPFAFQVQAYYILYTRFGFHNAFLWVTSAVTFAMFAATCAYAVMDE